MADFFTALLWGLAVFGALAGWGRLTAFFLERDSSQNSAASWLESPTLGIAVCAFLGGVLNLLSLANAQVIACCVIAGNTFLVISALRMHSMPSGDSPRKVDTSLPPASASSNTAFIVLLSLGLGLLVLRFASSILIDTIFPAPGLEGVHLNLQDDYHSYVVSVERMLETGSIGIDPFNSRQAMSALGAEHFLNGLVLCLLPYDNVHMLEGGVGLTTACLAAAALALRWNLGKTAAAALLLVPLLVYSSYANITSTMTSAASLLGLISAVAWLFQKKNKPSGDPLIILRAALFLSAACALKTTTIPSACIFVLTAFTCHALYHRSLRLLLYSVLTGVAAVVFLSPWLLWQHQNAGTPLYPLLGLGHHALAFHPQPFVRVPDFERQILLPILIPPSVISGVILLLIAWPRTRPAAIAAQGLVVTAFLFSWMAALVALGEATQYANLSRYIAPTRLAGIAVSVAFAWSFGHALGSLKIRNIPFVGPVAFAAAIIGLTLELYLVYALALPANLASSFNEKYSPWAGHLRPVRAMQSTVPPGEKILVYLQMPFLMDFRRNTVYVADWPGETSPPPGMPVFDGGDAVSDYLLKQGVRYAAYSYKYEANFPRNVYAHYTEPANGAVISRQAAESFAFQDDMTQLRRTRRAIYDDGDIVLFDLQSPTLLTPPR